MLPFSGAAHGRACSSVVLVDQVSDDANDSIVWS